MEQRRVVSCYTIDDLASLTGVSPRTIKYYRFKRLLSPATKDPNFPWGPQHVAELRKITAILAENRTLDDIRELLHGEDAE